MHIRYNSLTLELVNGRYLYFTKVILVYFSTGKRYMFTYINMLFFIQIIIMDHFRFVCVIWHRIMVIFYVLLKNNYVEFSFIGCLHM